MTEMNLDIPKSNKMLQITNGIMVINMDDEDTVIAPMTMSLADIKKFYIEDLGRASDEMIKIRLVDIEKEGMWVSVGELPLTQEEEDEMSEVEDAFKYIPNIKEIVINNPNDKFGNYSYFNGELSKYMSFKEYITRKYLDTNTKLEFPEMIASVNF